MHFYCECDFTADSLRLLFEINEFQQQNHCTFFCTTTQYFIFSLWFPTLPRVTLTAHRQRQRERDGAQACSIQLWVQYVGGGSDINIFPVKKKHTVSYIPQTQTEKGQHAPWLHCILVIAFLERLVSAFYRRGLALTPQPNVWIQERSLFLVL